MEYPFKELQPLGEVLEREGYYKDWTHLDPEVFYSLTQISEYIKTKGFGVDVRLLIAQLAEHFGLKTTQINQIELFFKDVMQELAEDKDFHSLPEIAGARGGFDTLGERLNDTTTQLAQKVGGGNKAELEDLSSTVLSAIEGGEGTEFNLLSIPQDNSVTEKKTTFIESNNLWDGAYHNDIYVSGNEDIVRHVTGGVNVRSAIVGVTPGEKYTVEKREGGDRFNVAVVSEIPALNEDIEPLYLYRGANSGLVQNHSFIVPEGGRFIVLHINAGTTNLPNVIVSLGGVVDDKLRFKKDIEGYLKLEKSSKNIFNGDYTKAYVSLHANYGSYHVLSAKEGADGRTFIASVTPNQTYSISLPDEDNDRLRVVTNADLINISSAVNETTQADELIYDSNIDGVLHSLTITVGENQRYLYIHVSSEGREPRLQVELGDKVTGYEPHEFIPEKYLLAPQKTDKEPVSYPYDLIGVFDTESIENYNNPTNVQASEVIADFDELQANFPEYISPKESVGELSNGEHIYSYAFKPHQLNSDQEIRLPKIIIVGGTHGDEKNSVYSMLNFFKKMCHDWRDDKVLEYLRFNVEFVVVPIFNVNGFNNHQRFNLNDVDLNRNFPTDGTEGSEEETKILASFLQTHNDADFMIDFHRVHWYNDGHVMYALVNDSEVNEIMSKTQHYMGRKWQREYNYFPQEENHKFGYTANHISGTLANYGDYIGIRSTLIEMTWEVRWQPGWTRYHDLSVLLGTELLGNAIKRLVDTL